MKHIFTIISVGISTLAMTSCDETISQAGSSLVEDEIEIIEDSSFKVSGLSDPNPSVKSRTVLQLLGRLSAEGYGDFSSDIVCQYMPAANLDTINTKAEYVDSVKLLLTMYKNGFVGDSVVPMGVSVYKLNRQLSSSDLFSDFDPTGYYDSQVYAQATYSAKFEDSPYAGTDSEGSTYKHIAVDLPREFGVDLYNQYKRSPETFSSPQAFAQYFPGLYITTSFGSGRVVRISSNSIQIYYHSVFHIDDETNPRDTTINYIGSYLGVTPEVYTNNNISYNMSGSLKTLADAGAPILVGPLGYDVEFKFPAQEILDTYKSQAGELAIVNSLSFSLPASAIDNDYGINPPPYILMVKKSEKEKFFSSLNVNDNLSSFYASYNSTTGKYTFSSMLNYINDIIKRGEVTEEDEEFVICPVNISYYPSSSSSSYYYYYYGYSTSTNTISSISPYVTEPVMAKLNFEDATIEFTFTKQTL